MFAGGVATALLSGPAYADDKDDLRALKEQLEAQKKQIEELQKQVGKINLPPVGEATAEGPAGDAPVQAQAKPDVSSVEKIVGDYLKRRDEEKKKKEDEEKAQKAEEGFKVGSDLKMNVRWNPANGVTFETANKDFVSHLGVRIQYDNVWWYQNSKTKVLTQNPTQIGDLEDGTYFRRVRPSWDGTAWEVIEWNIELAYEQTSNNVPNLDEAWAGVKGIPIVGTFRAGHIRVPQGLEGDMYSSSKAMTFMERSMYTDAFYQNFASGFWLTNSFLDQRVTYAAALYRQDNDNILNSNNNGVDFNDGAYGYTVRGTVLPIWENDGRCFLHLGASYTNRVAEFPNSGVYPNRAGQGGTGGAFPGAGAAAPAGFFVGAGPRTADFAARPQLRDAIGAYGGAPLTGNSTRIVNTGLIACDDVQVLGTELLYVRGPFSLQAEYGWANMQRAYAFSATKANNLTVSTRDATGLPSNKDLGSPWFDGGYVQASYFLTGENRIYDRRLGRIGTTYIAAPNTPFWLTKGEDHWLFGRGAWEVAARWNHLDLNNGLIKGGISDAFEASLNWYLSTNMKFQFEYLWQDRYDVGATQRGAVLVPQTSADIQAIGMRMQFFF
jgi:phosphate-selective porin OprO/OprP